MSTAQRVSRAFHRLGLFLAATLTGTTLAEASDATWTCAYPSYFGNREPVIVTFAQRGNTLKDGVDEYVILQDNDVGLVAAKSFSYVAKKTDAAPGLNLGAFVILIDKNSMRFRRGNVLMSDPDGAAAYGTCKLN
jgi:hypothetical protein